MYDAKGKLKQKDLIHEHLDLVKREALYMKLRMPDTVELDDLVQSGMLGLIDASKRYDPIQGVNFEVYARKRIRGAIIDEMRRNDWVPRRIRTQAKEIDQAIQQLNSKLGRQPEDREIAKHMGLDIDAYHSLLAATNGTLLVSFDEIGLTQVEESANSHFESPFDYLLEAGVQKEIADAIRSLPEREQQVLALYYTEEVNMREIGEILGVSESRICQIHASAMARLRASLIDHD